MREALVFYSAFDGDPARVRYVLAWKPPAGFFAPIHNLKLRTEKTTEWREWSALADGPIHVRYRLPRAERHPAQAGTQCQ